MKRKIRTKSPVRFTLRIGDLWMRLASSLGLDQLTTDYCLKRFRAEGIKFFSVVLPLLAKAVEGALQANCVLTPKKGYTFSFTCIAWQGRSPRFFRGLINLIFDFKTGKPVRSEAAAMALKSLRTLCYYYYKLALGFSASIKASFEAKYVDTERSLAEVHFDGEWVDSLRRNFETYYQTLAKAHVSDIFAKCRPRWTPGAVVRNNIFTFWQDKCLAPELVGTTTVGLKAHSGYFKAYPSQPTSGSLAREARRLAKMGLGDGTFRPSRVKLVEESRHCEVLFVPKDSRGPRVISKEPFHLIRAQMSFLDFMSSELERLTDNRINFVDQSINRELARFGSIHGDWATLDLKDASDRVQTRLMRAVFRHAPGLRYALDNLRSTHAVLPSGEKIPLRKLAGMGSGLTFATMALLIHLSICTLVSRRIRLPYEEVSKRVYVYGDDVVVPSDWYAYAVEALSNSGLLVNSSKSFRVGPFRESCGGDYYAGYDVTPLRMSLRSAGLPVGLTKDNVLEFHASPLAIINVLEHARRADSQGHIELAEILYQQVEQSISDKYGSRFRLPYSSDESVVLGRYASSSTFACNANMFNRIVGFGRWTSSRCSIFDRQYRSESFRVLKSSSNRCKFDRMNPYWYLGQEVLPESPTDPLEYLFPAGSREFGELSKPRSSVLRSASVGLAAF